MPSTAGTKQLKQRARPRRHAQAGHQTPPRRGSASSASAPEAGRRTNRSSAAMIGQMSDNHAATCARTPAHQGRGQVSRIDRLQHREHPPGGSLRSPAADLQSAGLRRRTAGGPYHLKGCGNGDMFAGAPPVPARLLTAVSKADGRRRCSVADPAAVRQGRGTAARVAADAGVPGRTARRWRARWRAGAWPAETRPARAGRSRRRFPVRPGCLDRRLALQR
jgi:hypothetical protein